MICPVCGKSSVVWDDDLYKAYICQDCGEIDRERTKHVGKPKADKLSNTQNFRNAPVSDNHNNGGIGQG